MTGHRSWSELRAAYLADMTPEQRALYEQARRDLQAELAKYAAEHPEGGADDGEESR